MSLVHGNVRICEIPRAKNAHQPIPLSKILRNDSIFISRVNLLFYTLMTIHYCYFAIIILLLLFL
jgi:hypothetical protein